MTQTFFARQTIDLRPVGLYDTGHEVLRPDVDSAVESLIATGCEVHVYEKRTLMALYKNVSRRNGRRPEGTPELRLWTHRVPDPESEYQGKWMIRLRQPEEWINPFFTADQDSQYGRWLPLAEQLILGEEVRVKTVAEVVRLGQSFRFACDKRGLVRQGRMLRRRKEGREWVVVLAKALEKKEAPVETSPRRRSAGGKSRKTRGARSRSPGKE